MALHKNFDVIIVGGSYAGLSAAMALGRSMRNVLIIDSGIPCNRQTPHSHNFLTQDGETPAAITEKARVQVLKYDTVTFCKGLAVTAQKSTEGFTITTESKATFLAKKLIFATGIQDIMPAIKGFSDCWGISVIHCPYCHGFEFRQQKTAIMANGERAFHVASLVSNLTDELTILTTGKAEFNEEQREKLSRKAIRITETEISELSHENGKLNQVVFADGSTQTFAVLYASLAFRQHSDLPAILGCEFSEQGYIKVDAFQKTTVHGVYACGDNSSMMRSVANAVATGNLAGAMVNKELTDERF